MKKCLNCYQTYTSEQWQCPHCNHAVNIHEGIPCFHPMLESQATHYPIEFYDKLFQLESNYFWFQRRNDLILWALEHYFPKAKNLIEIGCGTGYVLSGIQERFAHIRCTGSELYSSGLYYAQQRLPTTEFIQLDARELPFIEEFELIGAFDVLEHIQEDIVVLEQSYQALKPSGGLLITVPQHMFLWGPSDEHAHHVRRYNATELEEKVANAGFKILFKTSFVTTLFPLMLASRIKSKSGNPNHYDELAEYQIPNWLNQLFKTLMGIDMCLIKSQIMLPFGGSLLIVAKKL